LTQRRAFSVEILQGAPSSKLACNELLDRLNAALLPQLSVEAHWLRFFFIHDGHQVTTSEVLVDNADWPEGRRIIETLNWPDGEYSAREFLMLRLPESSDGMVAGIFGNKNE